MYYWPDAELTPWLLEAHNDFVLWLNSKGGQPGDPFKNAWHYAREIDEVKRAARATPDSATAPASETPRKRRRTTASDKLHGIEEAGRLYYDQLLTQSEIVERTGKSEATIKRYLRAYRKNKDHKDHKKGS